MFYKPTRAQICVAVIWGQIKTSGCEHVMKRGLACASMSVWELGIVKDPIATGQNGKATKIVENDWLSH